MFNRTEGLFLFSNQPQRGWRSEGAWHRTLGWWALPLLGVSCQSYSAAPLHPTQHIQAWQAQSWRDLADAYAEAAASLQAWPQRFKPAPGPTSESWRAPKGPEPVSLDVTQAQALAKVLNPELRGLRLNVAKAAGQQEWAGLWDDPEFDGEFARNIDSGESPWSGLLAGRIPIPLSDRLAARKDWQAAEAQVALQELRLAEWETGLSVQETWLRWSYHLAKQTTCESYVAGLQGLIDQSHRMVDAGEWDRTEANLFLMESKNWQAEARQFAALAQYDQALLRIPLGIPQALSWVGQPVDLGVEPLPPWAASDMAESHPELILLRTRYAVSEQVLRMEIAKQIPDLGLGPLLENDGEATALGVSFGWSLPIWDRNQAEIAKARADRDIARAAYESRYQILVGQAQAAQAQETAYAQAVGERIQSVLPLMTEQVEQTRLRLELGEANSLLLLEALRSLHSAKQELIELQWLRAQAQVEIERTRGPLPNTNPNQTK